MNKLEELIFKLEDKYGVLDFSGDGEPLEECGYDACDVYSNEIGDIIIKEFFDFLVNMNYLNPNEKINETIENFD